MMSSEPSPLASNEQSKEDEDFNVQTTTPTTRTTTTTTTTILLPPHTFGIMIHKNYQARLLEVWQPTAVDFVQVVNNKGPKSSLSRRGYHVLVCHAIQPSLGRSGQQQQRLVSPLARQNISWMARLQYKVKVVIAAPATVERGGHRRRTLSNEMKKNSNHHHHHNDDKNITNSNNNNTHDAALSKAMASQIWPTIIKTPQDDKQSPMFDLQRDMVRVDVFPRTWLEPVCAALQQEVQAWRHDYDDATTPLLLPSDLPFDGPLRMTASRSQCTLRLTIVLHNADDDDNDDNNNDDNHHHHHHDPNPSLSKNNETSPTTTITTTTTTCYWGMDRRPTDDSLMDIPLNHEAHEEMVIVPMSPTDGKEIGKTKASSATDTKAHSDNNSVVVAPTVPLSRAYYKLWQVWNEELVPHHATVAAAMHGGTGLDVGASPGGWTQVLLYGFQCASVICLDPAVVAQRVLQHPGVYHVACHLEKWRTQPAEYTTQTPLSTLVCDASILWDDLLKQLSEHVMPFTRWKLPAVLVLTCKLPSRSAKSIARQVQGIQDRVPGVLQDWKSYFTADYKDDKSSSGQVHDDVVKMEWKLLHLFANSESERTLLIVVQSATAAGATAAKSEDVETPSA